MTYGIRVRDGIQVGTITGNLDNFNVPDGETLETFGDARAFADRLAELTPDRSSGPTAQDVLDAIAELAAEGSEVESRIHERAEQKAAERTG